MKIAFATQNVTRIDAHFGWARFLAIYEVSDEGYHFEEVLRFGGELRQDGNPAKLAAKVEALDGCALVFADAIGEEAQAMLAQRNIQTMRGFGGQPIEAALDHLHTTLRGNPQGWLRSMMQNDRRRQAGSTEGDEDVADF